MTDREKIIKAIENAKKQSIEYAQEYILVPLKETDMILNLLKEQEPAETERRFLRPEEQYDRYRCGKCGFLGIMYKQPYCGGCGRKVKWE